jgi:hypothetical protein
MEGAQIMDLVIKILQAFLPILIEIIKTNHAEKSHDEHKEILRDLFNKHL